MTKPTLYIFTISHYCEKARWALDYLAIAHNVVHLGAGLHIQISQELGLKTSSLPILKTDKQVIQGASEIIDWAEKNTATDKTLTPANCEQHCRKLEQKIDDILGIHTRRFFYSEALIEHPDSVKTIFYNHLSAEQKKAMTCIWGFVAELMIKKMDLGERQGDESKAIVATELEHLEGLLADGRSYLACDQLTRADIAAASFCSFMVNPTQHPEFDLVPLPPRLSEFQQQWLNRPVMIWIKALYQQHR